jgi:hypothetical protein
MVRPDPGGAATAIATDLGAELAIGGPATEQAVARRTAQTLDSPDLEALAAAMRRAEAIRERTRAEASQRLSASLNDKVAIHPDTMRRAAAELRAAQHALDQALDADGRRSRRRRWAAVGTGAATLAAAATAVVVAAVAPPAAIAVAGVGVGGAGAAERRVRRKPPPAHESLRSHVAWCRRRWERVGGEGADPADVDAIIHRYDPQDSLIVGLLDEHPAVRAAERMVLERRLAWVTAWRQQLGGSPPLEESDAPDTWEMLRDDRSELWLTATAVPPRQGPDTLVVAAPYADLPEHRAREVHRRLVQLPRGQRVIVVLSPDAGAPHGASAPGPGWVGSDVS